LPNPTYIKICQELEKHLLELKPEKCISGMALGWDQYSANVCIKLGIPFDAYIPFLGQEKAWPQKSQTTYHKLLAKAANQIIVCAGGYAAYKMQVRNEAMCNNCDILIACFDGTNGGTANCINYAKSKNKKIIFINPRLDM
jgi:uncharacterized phage-like protein YoqJ